MPIDSTQMPRDATVTTAPGSPTPLGGPGGSGGPSGPGVVAGGAGIDRVDIQPLDAAAALQILLAEVSVELGLPMPVLPGDRTAFTEPSGNSTHTAQTLVRLFLDAIPEAGSSATPAAWLAVVDRLESTFQAALARGVETVAGWQEVSRSVAQTCRETQALVQGQLTEAPQSPYWVRPEWAGFAFAVHRFWRRRRVARRALSDPDLEARWLRTEEARDNIAPGSDE